MPCLGPPLASPARNRHFALVMQVSNTCRKARGLTRRRRAVIPGPSFWARVVAVAAGLLRPRHDRPGTSRNPLPSASAGVGRHGAIAWLDDQLSVLLGELERRGLLDNTIVIVTSDHGEEFLEHSVMTHGNSLYGPALLVPLLVSFPGRVPAGGRVPAWVSTTDLAATVLDLAGIEHALPGRSLARHWMPASAYAGLPDTLRARVSFSWQKADHYPISDGDIETVLVDPWKYILNGDGREELYDLRSDPGESRDLAGTAASDSLLTALRARVGEKRRRRSAR